MITKLTHHNLLSKHFDNCDKLINIFKILISYNKFSKGGRYINISNTPQRLNSDPSLRDEPF